MITPELFFGVIILRQPVNVTSVLERKCPEGFFGCEPRRRKLLPGTGRGSSETGACSRRRELKLGEIGRASCRERV